jgi:sulfoxide reductase heme-binding subunit YedZ
MAGTSRSSEYWRARVTRHIVLAVVSIAGIAVVGLIDGAERRVQQLSMGTAYTGLALIGASLLIGPLNVLRRRPNPVSADLRRDVGIWAALVSSAHVVFGLQVHLPGRPWEFFVWGREQAHAFPLRYDAFGFANWGGLGAAIVLLVLLAISNDLSLRRLGTTRWKRWQRWNYAAFGVIAAHGVIYQVLEDRPLPWVIVFGATLLTVFALQLVGWRAVRDRAT